MLAVVRGLVVVWSIERVVRSWDGLLDGNRMELDQCKSLVSEEDKKI